jgi:uridylate kinase
MEPVVLSLGGSVLVDSEDSSGFIMAVAAVLKEVSRSRKVYVVTGGGKVARFYIRNGRALGAGERTLDELGIGVTRLNARLLILALGASACPSVPVDYDEAAREGKENEIVVMGGVSPGITTDAVSAFLAKKVGAKLLVNATSVDGAYTADPKKDPKAKKIPRMTHAELLELVGTDPLGAGPNVVFDPTGAKVLADERITLAVVEGRDLKNLGGALVGMEFKGTIVR